MSTLVIPPTVGALAPPPGVIANLKDPENSNALIYSALGVYVAISTALVFVRSYTRFSIIKRRSWEDCEYFDTIAIAQLLIPHQTYS